MKAHCEKRAEVRTFELGVEVLVLLSVQGKNLAAKFTDLYVVKKMENLYCTD